MLVRACVQCWAQSRGYKGILEANPSDIAFLTSNQTDHPMHNEVEGRPRTCCGCNPLTIIYAPSPSLGSPQTTALDLGLH
jgi:hypothetical protein